MALTNDQARAITLDHTNILVSAGAGSGKTKVLSERVIRKCKEGFKVDQFIILTFTNAAAAEMKHRIKKLLSEDETLRVQIPFLDNAYISTFDAFCLRIVKQYHYLLDLPEEIEIADTIQFQSLYRQTLEEFIQSSYQSKEKSFEQLIRRLWNKTDDVLYETITMLITKMEMDPHPVETLQNMMERPFSEDSLNRYMSLFQAIIKEELSEIATQSKHLFSLLTETDLDKLIDFAHLLEHNLSFLFEAQNINDFLTNMTGFTYPRFPIMSKDTDSSILDEIKGCNEIVKDLITKLKTKIEALGCMTENELRDDMLEIKHDVREMLSQTIQFYQYWKQVQKKNGLFSFSDIMSYAIQLIENEPSIRAYFLSNIEEIMIDEYQDTNNLQEYMMHLISKNNLFMVGDMKQSIYGFRNANPKNFRLKFEAYHQKNGGELITLKANFRSRNEVLKTINQIFDPMMDNQIGGIDYRNDQALQYGNHTYDVSHTHPTKYHSEVLYYQIPEDSEQKPIYQSIGYLEGHLIAKSILKKKEEGFSVLKKGNYESITWKDICILIDRKSDFDDIERALIDQNIPVNAIKDETFLSSTEILTLYSFLQIVSHIKNDTASKVEAYRAFYSVSRSFIYQIEDDDITKILLTKPKLDYVFFQSLQENSLFNRLSLNILHMVDLIDELPLSKWFQTLYETLHLYEYIHLLDDTMKVESKLDFLLSKVSVMHGKTFDDLMFYFDEVNQLEDLDIEYAQSIDLDKDAVKLMTIHKSKGLEFPICYFPMLSKKFNFSESKSFFQYHDQIGLFTKTNQQGLKDNLYYFIARYLYEQETVSERMRLFYVALTRAKDQIVFVINQDKMKTDQSLLPTTDLVSVISRRRARSFLDFLTLSNQLSHFVSQEGIPDETIPSPKHEEHSFESKQSFEFTPFDYQIDLIEEGSFSKQSHQLFTNQQKQAIEFGEKIHLELAHLDFKHLDQSLANCSKIVKEGIEYLRKQPIFSNIEQAQVYQEYEFYTQHQSKLDHGIIDLLIEYEDHFIILDYKLKQINDDAYEKQLNGYYDYLSQITQKPIECYLFSILSKELIQIKR